MCGVAADGRYQASGFFKRLRGKLELEYNDELALPITWDSAHMMNLAVIDVRDAKTESGVFFSLIYKEKQHIQSYFRAWKRFCIS